MLFNILLAMLAFALTALADGSITGHCHPTETVTSFVSVASLTVTLPASTITLCSSGLGETTFSPTATAILSSLSSIPAMCTDGYLRQEIVNGTTLWPCGAPDSTDSLVYAEPTTMTLQPVNPSDLTTTWVTVTDSTSTLVVPQPTPSEEVTTTIDVTSFMTVTTGTSTIIDSSSALNSSSKTRASSFTGFGPNGWNSTTSANAPAGTGTSYVTGITGAVTVPPHVNSTAAITETFTIVMPTPSNGTYPSPPFPANGTSTTANGTLNTVSWLNTTLPWTPTATVISTRPFNLSLTTPEPAWTVYSTELVSISSGPSGNVTFTQPSASHTGGLPPAPFSTMCPQHGEYGNFTMTWDEPHRTPDNKTHQFPPVFEPYHHLMFANGFAYVPPPNQYTSPHSSPYMAMYLPNMTTTALLHPQAGALPRGGIGAGLRASNSAFWFNAYGAFMSCNQGQEPADAVIPHLACKIEVAGFRWSDTKQKEVLHNKETFDIPACWSLNAQGKCELPWIDFTNTTGNFDGLSSIRLNAYYWNDAADDRIFVMDNLQLSWADNSCAAGRARQADKL